MVATLSEARAELMDKLDEGTMCPVCGQFAKLYHRKITGSVARVLVEMYRRAGTGWVSLPKVCNDLGIGSRGDQSAARRWGLIEQRPGPRKDGAKSAGWWRLTPLGAEFVCGTATVPKYALVYDNTVLDYDGDQIGIREALGEKFNYDELMAGI